MMAHRPKTAELLQAFCADQRRVAMGELDVKEALRRLVQDAVRLAGSKGSKISEHRGKHALHNPAYEEPFKNLESFSTAVRCIASLPQVIELYGTGEVERLTLQFLYAYFDSARELVW